MATTGTWSRRATGAVFEVASLVELAWTGHWIEIECGRISAADLAAGYRPQLPKTIDITTDFLRGGLPRDAFALAGVNRSGRRFASVRVEAWQGNRTRPVAQATGRFLMPGDMTLEPDSGHG